MIIFNAATELVKRTFVYKRAEKATIDAFKNKAQFTLSDLRKATKDCVDDIIPMENIVTLFEYHKILAALPRTGESKEITYFMPSVLKSATPDELHQIQSYSQVAPLMFRYECGYLPLGVFSSLVITLVSLNNPKWRLIEDNLSRNKIDFRVDYMYTVTLINQPTFLKVIIQSQSNLPNPTASVCHNIRNTLTDGLNYVNDNLRYKYAKVKYAFECPSCRKIWQVKHLSVVQDDHSSMICLKKNQAIVISKGKNMIWFQEEKLSFKNKPDVGKILGYAFTMKNLRVLHIGPDKQLCLIEEMSSQWKEAGDLLGLHINHIKRIQENNPRNVVDCCREVMAEWLDNENGRYNYSPSWEGLCELLKDLKLAMTAQHIQNLVLT